MFLQLARQLLQRYCALVWMLVVIVIVIDPCIKALAQPMSLGLDYLFDRQQMGAWLRNLYEILFSDANGVEITHFSCK